MPYVEGAVEGKQREKLERHLSDCPSCRAELEALRVSSLVLGESAPAAQTPAADLADRVLAEIARSGVEQSGPKQGWRVPRFAAAGAMAVLVAVVGIGIGRIAVGPETPPHARLGRSVGEEESGIQKSGATNQEEMVGTKPLPAPSPAVDASAGRKVEGGVQKRLNPAPPLNAAGSGTSAGRRSPTADDSMLVAAAPDLAPRRAAPPPAPSANVPGRAVTPVADASRARAPKTAAEEFSYGGKPMTEGEMAADSLAGRVPRRGAASPVMDKDISAAPSVSESKADLAGVGAAKASASEALYADAKPHSDKPKQDLGETADGASRASAQCSAFLTRMRASKPGGWAAVARDAHRRGIAGTLREQVESAFRKDPNQRDGGILVELQMVMNDRKGAAATADRMAALPVSDPAIWLRLGEVNVELHRTLQAIAAYEKAASSSDSGIAKLASERLEKLR